MAVIVKGRGPDGKPHPKSRYNAARRQAMHAGTWVRMQPAEPVQTHIKALMDGPARLRTEDVADRAGVPYGTVKNILQGRVTAVTGYVATRILAVDDTTPAARRWVDATGTRRRLQALAFMQWSCIDIGARLGVCNAAVARWGRGEQVHLSTADKMRALYDEISSTLGPSVSARQRALRLGWHGPLAWDDIDDPNEQPKPDAPAAETDAYDPVTVAFAVDGRLTYDQIQAHLPDLIETVRRLATRHGDQEITQLLRWPGVNDHRADSRTRAQNSLHKFRQRHGIPGREKYQAVYVYGTRSRARTKQAA